MSRVNAKKGKPKTKSAEPTRSGPPYFDLPDAPQEFREVGTGVTGHLYEPEDPSVHLQFSAHPHAPFPGPQLKWRSNVYWDGTVYVPSRV